MAQEHPFSHMHVFETSLHTLVQPLVYYAFQLLDKESSASREI